MSGPLILVGLVLVLLGLMFAGRLGPLGRLPGDIHISLPNFTFCFPLATGLLISLVISVALWVVNRFR